jgi:hypothetical protein
MNTLQIRKKSEFVWEHIDSVLGRFIVSNFFVNLDDNKFQVVEKGKAQRLKYDVSSIVVFDDTVGGMPENFGDMNTLSIRLTELYYPAWDYKNKPIFVSDAGITGSLKTEYIYAGGLQEFTLPANSKVVLVTLNYAVISDWTVLGNILTIGGVLDVNDQINVYGFISTSSTIDDYKQTFIYNGGSQSFTIPASTYISIITYNGAPISDYTVAGTIVTIGTSITLVSLDEIIIYGITL